ncbi:MAG: ATP-binding protein [Thermoleophilia bacterium]|nr:ATP-binding protein [Thermoleophilia bacterium]
MEFVSYDIASNDFRRAGAASRSIKEHLKRIGADAEAIRRTMIAAYEAEMNVVIHSVGGRLEASLSDSQIDVSVVDGGPGIPDIERAMVEGYSTASAEARALGFGAGMGLPNIKRNSDRLRITSRVDEGTRVSFTVYLKPECTDGSRLISLYAFADRCRDCRACLTACPTQAMRVRGGSPSVLEHLCVDCTDCIAACSSLALSTREEITSLDDLPGRADTLLVVPPAVLAGCGADYPPAQVLAALRTLGFADVIVSAPFEEALREAAATVAAAGGTPSPRPVIVPVCPAVVNLIELRFPSLVPHLAPFDSPLEAVQAAYGDRPVAYVVSCPSQRSALLQAQACGVGTGARPPAEYLSPEVIRQAVMMRLTGHDPAGPDPAGATPATTSTASHGEIHPAEGPPAGPAPAGQALAVTGTMHVSAVLERIEDGLLDDVAVVEPYACDGGCFGSPLLSEDHHVAARRWSQGREAVEAADPAFTGAAVARRRPFTPRPGIRLDPDMGRAIQMLGELQRLVRSLPGRDCGTCGAPSCAALAEDVVMQRASVDLCPYRDTQKEDRD